MNIKDIFRKAFGLASLTLGIISLLYFLIWSTGILLWTFDIAVFNILLSGIFLVLVGTLILRNKKVLSFIKYRLLKITLILLIITIFTSFVVVEGFIIYNAFHNDISIHADFILIPGAKIVNDRPSRVLMQRLQQALFYIKENPNSLIIVSGAQGVDETYSEAEVMENLLIKNGVDANKIFKDEKAINSFQNVKYSKEIIDKIDNRSKHKLMIITNDYHIFRMKFIASNLGIDAYGISVPVHYSVIPICYTREYFSVLKMLIQNISLN